jgi:hypothetical protein
MRNKTKIVIMVAAMIVLGGIVFSLWSSKNRLSRINQTYEYSCYYSEGQSYARCISRSDKMMTCYGYYDLVGTNPKEGIKVNGSDRANTCEGFFGKPEFYFDRNGNFLD